MAETNPVRVVVEIVDNFSDELAQLSAQLEEIDSQVIDVLLEIAGDQEIESVRARLESLEEAINAILNISVDQSDVAEAEAVKQALSRDMRSTLHVDRDHRGPGGILDLDRIQAVRESTEISLNRLIPDARMEGRGVSRFAENLVDMDTAAGEFTQSVRQATNAARELETPRIPDGVGGMTARDMFGDVGARRIPPRVLGRLGGSGDLFRPTLDFDLSEFEASPEDLGLVRIGKTINRLRPNIMDLWNTLAALIPILITLAGAAIGLAGAFIALATAGAAILGLGLLGWGEDLDSTLQNLQESAGNFADTLHGVLEPVSDVFQPIVSRWGQGFVSQVSGLVDELLRLQVFASGLSRMGAGIMNWVGRVIERMADMEGMITQMSLRFGDVAGDFLIRLFTRMVRFAYENQDALIQLSQGIGQLLRALFDLSTVLAFLLTQLQPLLNIVTFLSGLMANEWVISIMSAVVAIYALEAALAAAAFAKTSLTVASIKSWVLGTLPYISTLTSSMWSFVASIHAAHGALVALLAATGIGLAVLGTGFVVGQQAMDSMSQPSPSPSRRGQGGGTYVEIHGDVRKREMDRLLDEIPDEVDNEMNIQQETTP